MFLHWHEMIREDLDRSTKRFSGLDPIFDRATSPGKRTTHEIWTRSLVCRFAVPKFCDPYHHHYHRFHQSLDETVLPKSKDLSQHASSPDLAAFPPFVNLTLTSCLEHSRLSTVLHPVY